MINTLFEEQISCQINFFAENITRSFFSLWRRLSINHVLGNKKDQVSPICRYGTSLWEFRHCHTQGIYKRRKELEQVRMNFSPTCRQKPERQCSTTIYCQGNSILQREKNNYGIHYKTGQNRGLSELKSSIHIFRLLFLPSSITFRRNHERNFFDLGEISLFDGFKFCYLIWITC